MRILGIDPGSRLCGYGVIECGVGQPIRYVECGVLTAPAHRTMEQRLGEIATALREVIVELAPTTVAMEDVFSYINPRSALALAQARGMALAVLGLSHLTVASYPPALVKKAMAGNGRADKSQIAKMVQAMLGLKSVPPVDATDALAVALTHARHVERAQKTSSIGLASAMIKPSGKVAGNLAGTTLASKPAARRATTKAASSGRGTP